MGSKWDQEDESVFWGMINGYKEEWEDSNEFPSSTSRQDVDIPIFQPSPLILSESFPPMSLLSLLMHPSSNPRPILKSPLHFPFHTPNSLSTTLSSPLVIQLTIIPHQYTLFLLYLNVWFKCITPPPHNNKSPMKLLVGCALVVMTLSSFNFLNQDAISKEVNAMKPLWVSGHNHYFDGQTMDEIKVLMGTLETPLEMQLPLKDIEPLKDIPTQFDPRVQWPNCESIKEVRDQSTCGSCWAFGAVEAMSDRICIASNQTLQTRLSSEDLLTCCGFSCGNGCNGGYPSAAWSYWKNTGIVTGWLYNTTGYCLPYTFPPCNHHVDGKYPNCSATKPTPKCTKACVSPFDKTYAADKHHGASVYSVPNNVAKIQTELMTNGPIEASFTVYEDFLTYTSGVYHHVKGSALGGHAIKLLGWGVENGTPYWLLANSWNEGWGDQGFFKIKRGNNECGIESGLVAGLPKLNQQLIEA